MQVTCPNCGARYAVDPLAIGPVGRIVQCARCAHRWLQTVAAATAAAREAVEAAMNSPLTAPKGPAAAEPAAPGPAAGPSSSFASVTPPSLGVPKPVDPAPDLVIRPPRERSSLPVPVPPRRAGALPMPVAVAIAAGIVLVFAIAAGVYFFGDDLVAKIPPEWRTVLNLH
ncbi:MAG: zinc-ribbon domain-containing protein [Proteobacteria bacterium]|nr:zinc-ribbon domain-containing protein [Pseudomonadota bacterium]